jgi:ParB family transcriptional regulator, chromosome partitioning protein
MASIKDGMRSFVADSVDDHAGTIGGQSGGPGQSPRSSIQRQGEGRKRMEGASEIRLDRIIPDPDQPRKEFDQDELHLLAEDIKGQGVLQPIRVRWDDAADRYVVIVGERRLQASRRAGQETIPCIVATAPATPEDLLEDQLVENALRLDLKPIEKAMAYRRLLDARGLSQHQLAERLHVSQTSISHALDLLKLPEPIQESVDTGRIAPEVGRLLVQVHDPAEQETLAREAEEGRLRRDDIRERVATARKATTGKGRGASKAGPPKPRVFRTPGARVTVELKRAGDAAAIRAALVDALGQLDAAGEGRGEAA